MLEKIFTSFLLIFIFPVRLLGQTPPNSAHGKKTAFVQGSIIGNDGNITIFYSDGRVVEPPKEKGQSSCGKPDVAPDKQTVGWLVSYENCCTSYPIPFTLIVYRFGKVVRRIRDGFPIWQWYFWEGGKQVVYHADTVHGNFNPHSVLLDVKTGHVIDTWEGNADEESPRWTKPPQ